jgi:16S rRNA (guanine966-N2)-methyltransferase
MGLESLSRGAAHATFFEEDRSAVALLRKNIEALGVRARSTVVDHDLFKWFDATPTPAQKVDVVFLDPPYRFLNERAADLGRVASRLLDHLSEDGVVVFRHDAKDALALPPLRVAETREYGGMTIELLSR